MLNKPSDHLTLKCCKFHEPLCFAFYTYTVVLCTVNVVVMSLA